MALAAMSVSACGVELSPSDGIPQASNNSCMPESECGDGYCSIAGICESFESELGKILLEITPSAGTKEIAGVRFTQVVDVSGEIDVNLGHFSPVTAKVTGAEVPLDSCVEPGVSAPAPVVAEDGSFPTKVTLMPRERLLGLPNPSSAAEAVYSPAAGYRSVLGVPPGTYDIYVEPLARDGNCVRPPQLYLKQEVLAGNVSLNLELPRPVRLDVDVRFPGMLDVLDGWTLDIIDRATGRRLSNQVVLTSPAVVSGNLEYRGRLAFSPVVSEDEIASSELIRLTPREGQTAPVVYLERTVAELFQSGRGVIDQVTSLPEPVTYSAQVTETDTLQPASAAVTLIGKSLDSTNAGVTTGFSRSVLTDEAGVFQVDLLPGDYRVIVEPLDPGLSQTTADMTVASGSKYQAGKVLQVGVRPNFSGELRSSTGQAVAGAPLSVAPRLPSVALDVIAIARGENYLLPRGESGTTGLDGTFSLLADPGSFHLVARPEAASGYPWGVWLGLEVAAGESIDLEKIRLTLPFAISGALSSSDIGQVPSALIRAYAFLRDDVPTSDVSAATSVVPVGEVRVDSSSAFRLLVPSSLR